MTTRKILGYIFILLALFLTLGIVGRLPELFGVIFNFFKMFTGRLDSRQVGYVIGSVLVWVLYFALTIFLFNTGRKRIKKDVKQDETN